MEDNKKNVCYTFDMGTTINAIFIVLLYVEYMVFNHIDHAILCVYFVRSISLFVIFFFFSSE